jgi:hypothetical protein
MMIKMRVKRMSSRTSRSAMYSYYCSSICAVLFAILLQITSCGSTRTMLNNNTLEEQYCEGSIENCRLSSKIVSKYEERLVKMNSYIEGGLLHFLTHEIECNRIPSSPDSDLYNQTRGSLEYISKINWKQILRNDTECMQQSSQLFCRQCLVNANRCSASCSDALEMCTRHISEELGKSWKIALGSIQTAVRLLVSQDVKYGCVKKKNFGGELIPWREPFLEDQQDKSACALVDMRDCSNSNKIKQISSSGRTSSGYYLQQLRIKLDDIAKILSAYWPRLETETPSPVNANKRSNPNDPSIILPETGSGSGQFYRNVLFEQTDDEDLLDNDGYGSGSDPDDLEGSGGGNDERLDNDLNNVLDNLEGINSNNTKRLVPTNNKNNNNPSSGGRPSSRSWVMVLTFILLQLLPSPLYRIRLTT